MKRIITMITTAVISICFSTNVLAAGEATVELYPLDKHSEPGYNFELRIGSRSVANNATVTVNFYSKDGNNSYTFSLVNGEVTRTVGAGSPTPDTVTIAIDGAIYADRVKVFDLNTPKKFSATTKTISTPKEEVGQETFVFGGDSVTTQSVQKPNVQAAPSVIESNEGPTRPLTAEEQKALDLADAGDIYSHTSIMLLLVAILMVAIAISQGCGKYSKKKGDGINEK